MASIAFFNRSYWPDAEATGQLLADLCEYLASNGHEVHVICGQPNRPKTGEEYVRTGIQTRNGVRIHRLRHTTFPKRIPAARLLNLISFSRAVDRYLSRSSRDLALSRSRPKQDRSIVEPTHAVSDICRLASCDTFVTETDPFLLPPIIAKHATNAGARFIAYLQDIYPDVAIAIGKAKPGWVTEKIRARLKKAYEQADQIIVLGSCMKDRLTNAPWELDEAKIEVIPNWADCNKIHPIRHTQNPLRRQWNLDEKFVVMHSGNMGLTQRLDVLIDATREPSWPEDAVLVLVGDGAAKQELQQKAAGLHGETTATKRANGRDLEDKQDGLTNRVRFFDYVPREELANSLSAADLHAISMHEGITGCLCPSKLYGVLAADRPVLAIAPPETDLARTVIEHQAGHVVQPGSQRSIAQAVAHAFTQKSANTSASRRLAEKHFDRPVVFKQLSAKLVSATPS